MRSRNVYTQRNLLFLEQMQFDQHDNLPKLPFQVHLLDMLEHIVYIQCKYHKFLLYDS